MPNRETGMTGQGGPGMDGGFGGQSNPLVQRFGENPEWSDLQQTRAIELRAELYESGVAAGVLEQWVELLRANASDLVDDDTISLEAAAISRYFEG